jgi:transposase
MAPCAALPDLDTLNHETLKALIVAQHEQLLHKDEQLTSRDEEIERLNLLIAKLRRMRFGRKSEKLDWEIEQLELKLDELQASRAQQVAACPSPLAASNVNRATKRARQPLPDHLPRETHKILPKQETCPDCRGALKPLGEDVSEILEYMPEHFKVIRQVRPKLACARCDKIVQAEAVSRPIERGIAGPGLLAHVLVSKYADHLPLYRQAEIYARDGVELDRSTMAEWVGPPKPTPTPAPKPQRPPHAHSRLSLMHLFCCPQSRLKRALHPIRPCGDVLTGEMHAVFGLLESYAQ